MIRIVFRYQEKRAIAYDFNTEIGECNFEETEDIWNITHTEVNEKYQGQGIAKKLVENVMENAKRLNKSIEATCSYAKKVIEKNKKRLNQNAKNIQKIAITDTYTVGSKVKEMYKELIKHDKFVFNNLFSQKQCNKVEVVTAFTGLLEMSRRSKVQTSQQNLFGDILVEKHKRNT